MTFITIQQHARPDLSRPWPLHIGTGGTVGQQGAYKGDPSHLIGFQEEEGTQSVSVLLPEFEANPEVAVGKYPVFVRSNGTLFVSTLPVADVSMNPADFDTIAV